ncbi:MAG: MFS transporter [Burkholderiales bacterium]|nr:MFS transporter [Burkholderiales bacterium]
MTALGTRTALVALAATLAIQGFASVAATAPAVLAPVLARDFGITPSWIGIFVGIMYAGAMLASLGSGAFITRYGAIRVSQACVLLCACGIAAMAALPGTAAPLLVFAAFAMGLGYGPITAASSELLARTTPPGRMALTFSIKQTGVPAGAAFAGAVLPGLALVGGWRAALLAIAVLGVAVAVASEPTRRALDIRQRSAARMSVASILGPLRMVCSSPSLLELALVGFAFAAVQVSLTSFLVVFLTATLHWPLVAAGLALTCATVSAVPGRIGFGAAADGRFPAHRILALIGTLACACGAAFAFATPHWPAWIVLPLAAAYGATAIGWNGVQLSELARRAPSGTAGAVTGAAGFITFGGVFCGPMLFAALTGVTGGYRAGFLLNAAISGIAAIAMLRRGAASGRRSL